MCLYGKTQVFHGQILICVKHKGQMQMRYHLDTIPVIEAYGAQSECPLCDLRQRVEQSYLESFLGASVMEPAVRIEVNKKGFCGPHFEKMFQMQNRLGLALITYTFLLETNDALRNTDPPKKAMFDIRKQKPAANEPCALCDRLSETMARYLYTTIHLWNTNSEFQKAFNESRGHCLIHYHQLLRIAQNGWQAKSMGVFFDTLHQLQLSNMKRIEEELKRFTEKFDYRNADKPFGESKDSLKRAINKLRGKYIT